VGIVRTQAYARADRYGAGAALVAAAGCFVVSLPAMHLLADSGSAFGINGFAGLTGAQQFSFWMTFLLFNAYVVLEVASLGAFYFASRPRSGRPNPAAIWYFAASLLVVMAFITTVWAAPAEKSFLDDSGTYLAIGTKAIKVFIGLGIAALAVLCLLAGALVTSSRKKASQQAIVI
jgi:hypothetical protein